MPDNIREQQEQESADKIRAGLKDLNGDASEGDDQNDDNDGNDDGNDDGDDGDAGKPNKPSDAEAKLLKEAMKYKADAKKAKEEAAALKKQFEGLDVDAIRQMLADKEAAETTQLEKKGEYERLLAKQREAADAKVKAEQERADKAEAERTRLQRQIEELTTGNAFATSKFVSEKLTLTPNKAKALYKSHFEFQDGKMVAYDKPAGEADRTPIVGADGEAVDFETAIAAIIEADPDKDYLLKTEQRPGAGSKPPVASRKESKEFVDTTDMIAAGLAQLGKTAKK